jgi:hypothetical protein
MPIREAMLVIVMDEKRIEKISSNRVDGIKNKITEKAGA